jgi:hypothetical protein
MTKRNDEQEIQDRYGEVPLNRTAPGTPMYDETEVAGAGAVFTNHGASDPIPDDYRPSPEEQAEGRRYSAMSFAIELAKIAGGDGSGRAGRVVEAAGKIEAYLRGDEVKPE